MTHVSFGTLIDYVRGVGSSDTRDLVRQHLAACARCAEDAARFARLAAIARADADTDPPDEVVARAIALFNAPRQGVQAPSDVARLVFDSATEPAPGPLDQTAVARARVLWFEAADIDVQLMVTQQSVRVSVAGQISARTTGDPLNGAVSAHRGSGQRAIARTQSNDSGEFRLDYEAPAAALLTFVVAGAAAPIDVLVTGDTAE